jgi:hypothetical protein
VNGNDSLPTKLISINQSKQANGLFLLETQKLNGLKSDNPADNTIINNFYQQYQTLNTATNALMTNYAFACAVFAVVREFVTTVS